MKNNNYCLSDLLNQITEIQKKLDIDSPLSVYFGYSQEGRIRLSFLSTKMPFKLESTRNIVVSQHRESTGGYWTHFDLVEKEQKKVFLSFSQSILDSVLYCTTEEQAFASLKKRYVTWKALFKNEPNSHLSQDVIQGVFGELYFLNEFMIPQYGVDRSIQSWAGADGKSKDFSIDDQWFEIKTIGANSNQIHISSLTQLDALTSGSLVVIKVEGMSEESSGDSVSILELFDAIRAAITDEAIENIFFSKLAITGVSTSEDAMRMKFVVKDIHKYLVDEKFPKLTDKTKPFTEICEAEYSLSLNSLAKYMEN